MRNKQEHISNIIKQQMFKNTTSEDDTLSFLIKS